MIDNSRTTHFNFSSSYQLYNLCKNEIGPLDKSDFLNEIPEWDHEEASHNLIVLHDFMQSFALHHYFLGLDKKLGFHLGDKIPYLNT